MVDRNRITAEHSLEANYLKLSCMPQERLDDIAIRVIKNDTPDFLMPIRTLKMNDAVEFRYTIGNQTALKYKDLIFNKVQFLQLYRNLLEPFIEGGDWMLDYHCYCIDSNYVFIDKNGRDVLYMYIPVDTFRNTDDEILNYFKDIVNRVTVEDDSAFLLKLYQSFSRGNVTLQELYQMVEQELQNGGTVKTMTAPAFGGQPGTPAAFKQTAAQPTVETNPAAAPVRDINAAQQGQFVHQQPQNKAEPAHTGKSARGILGGKSETSAQEKKGGLFGGLGKKHAKETETDTWKAELPVPSADTGEQDEVMKALFGTPEKKVKKKEKEKSGGLFSSKKKSAAITAPARAAKQQTLEKPVSVKSAIPEMQKQMQQVVPNYDYTQVSADSEVTQIEGFMVENSSQYLASMNAGMAGIPERIELNFPKERITIGRQSSDARQPDIVFSADYKRVGRMHACILRENDQYYVVDLGSANATVLNGEVLVPNQPYLLKNNDVVGFVAAQPIKYRVVL